jgi:hypothetical protein
MFIMGYLKFTLNFLIELIRINIVKIIFIIVAIVSFHYAGTFPPNLYTYNVLAETKVENTRIYVYKTVSNNKIKYNNIWSEESTDFYGDTIKVENGVIKLSSYNGFNVLFWFICGLFVLLLVIVTVIGKNDDDVGWELEDCWKEAFSTLIYCKEEYGKFYYFALGRLISERDKQVSRSYRITTELNIDGFRDLYHCPKYQTKNQRRETLLNKIGIN